jgi:hypothetical protein
MLSLGELSLMKTNKILSSITVLAVAALSLSACTSKSSLSMSRSNITVGTTSFNGKNVGIDLSHQDDVIHSSMGAGKYEFDNARNTVKTFFETSLKDKAKSVKEGKSDLTIKPKLNLDIVNDYFTAGCLAKVEVTLVNAKGEQIKAVSKDFKRTFVTSWGYKSACNEAATEVMALALSSL